VPAETETLTGLTAQVEDLRVELREEDERHERERKRIADEIAETVARREHLAAGTDADTREDALSLIEVVGQIDRLNAGVVRDAVDDLAAGCPKLKVEYFATKDYASFAGQRTDARYGYGPKHGCIVFKVGLSKSAREFLKKWGKLPGDDATREAAIRYLLNLEKAGVA
jgi:hypothetical protein